MDFLSQALEETVVLGESREPPPLANSLPTPTLSVIPTPPLQPLPNLLTPNVLQIIAPCATLLTQTVLYQNFQIHKHIPTCPLLGLMPLQQLH